MPSRAHWALSLLPGLLLAALLSAWNRPVAAQPAEPAPAHVQPAATPTPGLTAAVPDALLTPRPAATRPGTPVATQTLPALAHDLLFIADGALVRWEHASGRLTTLLGPAGAPARPGADPLPGSVGWFELSPDGRFAAVQRALPFRWQNEMGLLDLQSGRYLPLFPRMSPEASPARAAISPDNRWLAYRQTSETLYGVRLDAPDRRITLGRCGSDTWPRNDPPGCTGLVWSPDSRALAWSDSRGVWSHELGQTARLLLPLASPAPETGDRPLYVVEGWSPAGRYLFVRGEAGASPHVLDAVSGRAWRLPRSDGSGDPEGRAAWTAAGRLFVVGRGTDGALAGSLWRVDPEGRRLLVREITFAVPAGPDSRVIAAGALANERLAFALANEDPAGASGRGVFSFDPAARVLLRMGTLPPLAPYPRVTVRWADDGSAALIQSQSGCSWGDLALYLPAGTHELYNLLGLAGRDACNFRWAPRG